MTTSCNLTLSIVWLLVFTACGISKPPFEPKISYAVTDKRVQCLPTAFPSLKKEELEALFGKELYLGVRFVQEGDWYRALTAFKSALFLLPKNASAREKQIQFYIVLTYYFAGKYDEARGLLESYELSSLGPDFPAYRELSLMGVDLYDCTDKEEKRNFWLLRLSSTDQSDISLGLAMRRGDLCTLEEWDDTRAQPLLSDFELQKKSPEKARFLQAILPGAGYYYVGQKSSAVTSFIINALFSYASYQFFDRGYPAMGLITLSLESGWYLGGINGAGIAANEYNEALYGRLAKERMCENRLFPVLMLEYGF